MKFLILAINLIKYYSKTNLVITRSGASVLAELTNAKIPFIAIPLPTSADNHQYKNAEFLCKKRLWIFIRGKKYKRKTVRFNHVIYER